MMSMVASLLSNLSCCTSPAPFLLGGEVHVASHLKKDLGFFPYSLPFPHLTVFLFLAWVLPFAYRQQYTGISFVVLRCL